MTTVATGVANAADAQFLRAHGCAWLEGPVASESLSASDCEAALLAGQ